MAQTSQKLLLGLGYDPARSFGNPLYEGLLCLLQPGQTWWWSNLFNLLLAFVFLLRLPGLLPFLPSAGLLTLRLCLLASPVFTEAATSSMEYMLTWCLVQETLIASSSDRSLHFYAAVFFACFTRLELFPILALSFLLHTDLKTTGRKRCDPLFFAGIGIVWVLYLYWALGKNPSPFHDLKTGVLFYAGRIFFLFRQAGFLSVFYLVSLAGLQIVRREAPGLYKPGLALSLFFFLFPFEWAYAFPAVVIGLAGLISGYSKQRVWVFPLLVVFGSVFQWRPGSGFQFCAPLYYTTRTEMTELFLLSQKASFEKPCLVLYGATFLPSNTLDWEKLMDNRLFHRKNSGLYVGEKLSRTELDSLVLEGFTLYDLAPDSGLGKAPHPGVIYLNHSGFVKLLQGK